MNADPGRSVGSVVEEAARLVEALRVAGAHRPGSDGRSGAGGRARADDGGSPGEGAGRSGSRPLTCGICPVCRGIEFVGALPPEALERFADLARGVADLIGDFAASARARAEDLAEDLAGEDLDDRDLDDQDSTRPPATRGRP